MNFGHFESFFESHIGHYRGNTAGEQGFTRSRRTCEQEIVSARNGYFERALGYLLSADESHIVITALTFTRRTEAAGFYGSKYLLARE